MMISSYGRAVAFDGSPVVIGERINPTGKKRLQQALREHDTEFILREGLSQQEAGAQVLDVNVGVPGLDEVRLLPEIVQALQSVTPLPLQLDTSSPGAMEAALRVYNGKPLINSVNGKKESLEAILPLVKKYGGALVCLALDDDGIPETAEGRVAVAERIARAAEDYGIPRRELLMDALTLPVSADGRNGGTTLAALRSIKKDLGLKTVLGVSNVSFGLPRRDGINTAFFTLALGAGLDAAIINPMSAPMMDACAAFLAVSGQDDRCARYIARFGGEAAPQAAAPVSGELTLSEAIIKGLRREAAALAKAAAAESGDVMQVVRSSLVPALDAVGIGFEQGTLFLPQLLMSAEAAKAAFEELKAFLPADSSGGGPKIILATVKGDIHDIGKNIVKVLLENYRFQVIDLGKDVPPEVIVQAALENDVKLVGLSALMTTTAPFMAETISLLAAAKPSCKVMVGGAVLTREYADQIGADFYGKDAMASVHYAQSLFA
jgi:5-methyltetrahydrofolate--homocysteine methyltransferase